MSKQREERIRNNWIRNNIGIIVAVVGIVLLTFAFVSLRTSIKHHDTVRIIDCRLMSSNDIDDGDTIFCHNKDGKEEIRALGYDTPEVRHEQHGICQDQLHGRKATNYARVKLISAKKILVLVAGKDKYGRTLGHIIFDGKLLAIEMIEQGLAYPVTRYGDNGFPGLLAWIVEAAKHAPKPDFIDPHLFRKKMRATCTKK